MLLNCFAEEANQFIFSPEACQDLVAFEQSLVI